MERERRADVSRNTDQILEMAQYLDSAKKANPSQGLTAEIEKLVEQEAREEALQKIVSVSNVLSSAPERGTIALASPSEA